MKYRKRRVIQFVCYFWIAVLILPSVCRPQETKKNVVYAELLGPGVLYSINYERIITPHFTTRIGASAWSTSFYRGQSLNIVLPVLVNYLSGSGKSKLEIGVGADVFLMSETSHSERGNFTRSDLGAGFLLVGSLGYRYQPSEGGFHFRIVASPILAPITGFFFPSIGCSVGICY